MRYSKSYFLWKILAIVVFFSILISLHSCTENSNKKQINWTIKDFAPLSKLHTKIGKPGPSDWLAFHDEKGQAYANYCAQRLVKPNDSINKIYILPIGRFSKIEQNLLKNTADYISKFFMLEVKLLDPVSDKIVPETARRLNWDKDQLQTRYIFDSILIKQFPKDAINFTSITNFDLYPNDEWSFVFGEANLSKRVSVSSYNRFSDGNLDSSNYNICFGRIIKTATHEICHMFSIKHCRIYKCLLNGANHLEEADSKPIWLCPECLAKLQWCIKFDVIKRYDLLIEFFSKLQYNNEVEFYKKSKEIMEETLKIKPE
jgi:archaemetzincin